jgi:cytochrome c551/c552
MKTKQLLISTLVFLSMTAGVKAGPPDEGKAIFTSRCAGCHNVNQTLTGPALAGVDQRHSIDWIVQFVHSSQTLVKSGDKDAVGLYQKFNRITMPDHPDLTPDNIKDIVAYINAETVTTANKAPFARPVPLQTMYKPLSLSEDYLLFIGYLMAVALLIAVLLMAVRVKGLRSSETSAE